MCSDRNIRQPTRPSAGEEKRAVPRTVHEAARGPHGSSSGVDRFGTLSSSLSLVSKLRIVPVHQQSPSGLFLIWSTRTIALRGSVIIHTRRVISSGGSGPQSQKSTEIRHNCGDLVFPTMSGEEAPDGPRPRASEPRSRPHPNGLCQTRSEHEEQPIHRIMTKVIISGITGVAPSPLLTEVPCSRDLRPPAPGGRVEDGRRPPGQPEYGAQHETATQAFAWVAVVTSSNWEKTSGAKGSRTPDLRYAKPALCQLSYGPWTHTEHTFIRRCPRSWLEPRLRDPRHKGVGRTTGTGPPTSSCHIWTSP